MSILDRAKADPAAGRRLAVGIVFVQTLVGTCAQMLMKAGMKEQDASSALALLTGMISNPKLFLGFCLYGVSTVLMVAAFKYGELSVLYPIISLGYVWVTILSLFVLNETLNPLKIAGLLAVMLGVAVLGRSGRT